jgi:hypothetical protein
LSFSEFEGIERGKGDCFFAFGQEHYHENEGNNKNGACGLLVKFSNDGELLWRRRYRH